ncbi:hypothetical protein B0J13DRAFT_551799 [Dactylonectria estremocensis]|uniref:SMP-30/Gluconolactonase/LRE-like region domain-containing protein n=1 Tax=Dactylonectria estremocensis TaxID=1079267 RepID=A0A9P9F0M2_9HYPO|nr:hypothetical protein B0J13DRAFT_551799 [Dactylonectria estremocensis]
MLVKSLLATTAFAVLGLAKSLPSKTLSQLSLGAWLENIAVRPNGDLLVTQLVPSAIVYTIKEPAKKPHTLEALVTIPAIQNIYGIAELPTGSRSTETWIVVGGNSTSLANPVEGSFSSWKIELQRDSRCGKTKVTKVSDMSSDSRFLNGVTEIPGVSGAVLISDSTNGIVGYLNLKTGKFDDEAFVFPELAPTEGAALPVGVNGIHIRNGYLYWTNSGSRSIFRVAITPGGRPAKGAKPELVIDLSAQATFLDDFIFDADGNIYVTTNFDNSVIFVNVKARKAKTVVGGLLELTVAGSTSVAFGRGKHDKDILYVATGGALGAPVGGTKTEGGKIVAVDTSA